MAGMEVAGLVVGVAPIIFKATIEAWKAIDDAIDFDDDTEDLIIRLETIKAHLAIWAAKAGLTDGKLVSSLLPVEELIARTLRRIRDLIGEVDEQGKKYGLQLKDSGSSKRTTATVVQMRRSLHAVLASSRTKTGIGNSMEREATAHARPKRVEVSVEKRMLWAIRDKKRFEHFIEMLEQHVKGLRDFIVEKQQAQIEQDGARLAMDIIRGLEDPDSLSQLQSASGWDDTFSQIDLSALARWKTIAIKRTPMLNTSSDAEDWTLVGSSPEDRRRVRFLKASNKNEEQAYLFEKKEYDSNIDDDNKDELRERIRQLLSLLGGSSARKHLQTLTAVGYVDDLEYHCWWIVFRFPLSPLDNLGPHSNDPLSLRALYSSPLKPPLEARYKLAKRLVDTFAKLYGSEWLHKGINSKNVVFPHINSTAVVQSFTSVQTALIQGFNYSRQLTQAQTIDRGKVLHDLDVAVYRHPNYQGEAATGYQIHYDIYSLGLVLFEIALWSPIMDMLAAKLRPGVGPAVTLAPNMRNFQETEALELKRRIMLRVNGELAYRVGTKYKEMVQWCLNLEGPVTAIDFYNTTAIPLDELCSQY